ncbi:MAG: class A beta-lactamase [Pseudomonadota bacterium]
MQRRQLIHSTGLAAAGLALAGCAQKNWGAPPAGAAARAERFQQGIRRIEAASGGGRLGVALRDTGSGEQWLYRGEERFPMCSTFKLVAAALVLARVDRGEERLERRIAVLPGRVVANSPVTQARAGGAPMSLAELCEAAITLSDNTAGNLMLESFGGPAQLTAYTRTLGDGSFRLDRWETALNEALPGDPRDTTTPAAMVATLRRLALEDALSPTSRAQLIAWLRGNKTGGQRLRAQLPAGWTVADKTGSGDRGTTNDIGVLWPPGRAPLPAVCYLTGSTLDAAGRDQVMAAVGRVLAEG